MREVDIGAPRCLFKGATFVDMSFEDLLEAYLQTYYAKVFQKDHLKKAMVDFKTGVKLDFSLHRRGEI